MLIPVNEKQDKGKACHSRSPAHNSVDYLIFLELLTGFFTVSEVSWFVILVVLSPGFKHEGIVLASQLLASIPGSCTAIQPCVLCD